MSDSAPSHLMAPVETDVSPEPAEQRENQPRQISDISNKYSHHMAEISIGQAPPHDKLEKGQCHFLNAIPAEIRVQICQELLLFDENEPEEVLTPQVLATCRLVYGEAQPILEKNLNTTLLRRIALRSDAEPTLRKGQGVPLPMPRAENLDEELRTWVPVASGIRRAVVEVQIFHVTGEDRSRLYLQRMDSEKLLKARFQLYLLVTQALQSTTIKHVYFKLRLSRDGKCPRTDVRDAETALIQDLTLPIRQLHHDPRITLHLAGSITPTTKTLLFNSTLYSPRSKESLDNKTAMWKWLQVQSQARDLQELLARARMLHGTGVQYLMHSLYRRLLRPAGFTDHSSWALDYVQKENLLWDAAVEAEGRLTSGEWAARRQRAEACLAGLGIAANS